MSIEIETSTDSVEEVKTALGSSVEIEESEPEPEVEKKPAAKTAKAEEPEAEETDEPEEDESEESDDEPEEDEVKPKRAAPKTVPVSRLNQEINKRKAIERRLEALERTPAAKTEVAADETPKTYCGEPEPKLEDFTAFPDKYPDPYAALNKATGVFSRKEVLAEIAHNKKQEEIEADRLERTAGFRERFTETLERRPDYNDLVAGRDDIIISGVMQDFVYASDIGPDLLLHFAENPDDAEAIMSIRTMRGQGDAMRELEESLKAEIGFTPKETSKPKAAVKKSVTPLPKKQSSSAPAPITRLKPAGVGPKTFQELAGPTDRTGVDIEYNPEYERAVRAKRQT